MKVGTKHNGIIHNSQKGGKDPAIHQQRGWMKKGVAAP